MNYKNLTKKADNIFISNEDIISFFYYLFPDAILIFLLGVKFKAKTATITKVVPNQSIPDITKPKIKTEPTVADKGSKASSKLTVDGLT